MKLSLNNPEELLAAVPHMFGFNPEESVVLFPMQPGLPRVRIDMPATHPESEAAWGTIKGPYARNSHPGDLVAILCLSKDRANAELAADRLRTDLESIGVFSPIRLWTDDETWCDLDAGESGRMTDDTRGRIAAQMVAGGQQLPLQNRAAMAASMVGDRKPVAKLLADVRAAAIAGGPHGEIMWAAHRIEQFRNDEAKLDDGEAARMMVAVESFVVRDVLWDDIRSKTCLTHIALWGDLTRRAPDEVRAAPAALLAFASWLSGDGAKAWCAIEQVPQKRDYAMANLIACAMEAGLPPSRWEKSLAKMRVTDAMDLDAVSRRGPGLNNPEPRGPRL